MVFFPSLALAGLAAMVAAKSAVLDLVPSNFDDVVLKSGKPTLVEFFAPWCGHCKSLEPVYNELADSFAFAKDKVQIAKVNADAERDLGKRFGVQGFPTLKFFDGVSATPTDYSGGRDIDSLTAFISEKTGVTPKKVSPRASAVVMLTDATFEKETGGDKDVLVAFTAPWCGHCKSLAPTWEKLAEDFANEPNVLVAKVDAEAANSKATAKANGVKSYPTIKFFPRGSKTPEEYNEERDEAALVEFLNSKVGTHRVVGGGLNSLAGTVEALDKVVEQFVAGGSKAVEEATAAAKAALAALEKGAQTQYAEYYVRVFGKLASNSGYAAIEFARLDSILKKGGLASAKVDELTSKRNVLGKFVEKVKGQDNKGKDEL